MNRRKIRKILFRFTSLVEPLSLDEAFLDVSMREEDPAALAEHIRGLIYQDTALTASAGIAPNKMLAKIASDWNKPNGQFEIRQEEISEFMEQLPVQKLWGIGAKSAEKFRRLGIRLVVNFRDVRGSNCTNGLANSDWSFSCSAGAMIDERSPRTGNGNL